MLSRLFLAALWPTAGKGLTYWLLFVMFNCFFATFPCGILNVLISGLCNLSYFGHFIHPKCLGGVWFV